ncbi:MAG: fasciclin domain-containing protein [Acidimicrobiales bacterium]|nr:fasciclin domain-containing protein [Acidimicrobiales bacterium]
MTSPTRTLAAAAVVAALVLGACGSDDDDGDDGANASETTEQSADDSMETTTDAGEEATADADIVDTAIEAGNFETLVTAVQAAGLEETLRGEGPFTVFAPTDEAFAALPEGTLDTLLQDPTGDLAGILTYHVVEGEVMADAVAEMDGQEVTTVNGATVTVNVADDGSVSLTDAAGNQVNVVETDIETSNGVIHVLDGVLMPG